MKNLTIVAAASAILSGCSLLNDTVTLPTDTMALHSAVNAHTAIRDTHHHSIIGDYTHRDVVNPKSWRELNDSLPPALGS